MLRARRSFAIAQKNKTKQKPNAHEGTDRETTYKHITRRDADFFGVANAPDAPAALKLSSSETEESNAFPLWGKYSIYPLS